MGIEGGYSVVCDAEPFHRMPGLYDTRTDAAWWARHAGWAISKDSTRCPKHRRRPLATHEFVVGPVSTSRACWKCGWDQLHAIHKPA